MEDDEKDEESTAWYGSKKLMNMLTKEWRLKIQDIHDAVVAMKASAPGSPSMLAYAKLLIELCSNVDAQMTRAKSSPTVKQLVEVHTCLQRRKWGMFGSTHPTKGISRKVLMTGRIATIVGSMVVELRRTPEADAVDECRRPENFDDDDKAQSVRNPRMLSLKRREHGEMPLEATATGLFICRLLSVRA